MPCRLIWSTKTQPAFNEHGEAGPSDDSFITYTEGRVTVTIPVLVTAAVMSKMVTAAYPPSWSPSKCFSSRNQLDLHPHVRSIPL